MKKNHFPAGNAEFLKFVEQNRDALAADAAGYGLSAAETAALTAAVNEYAVKAQDYSTKRDAARVARVVRTEARATVEGILSGYFARIRAGGVVPDAKIVALGLKPRDKTRTAVKAPDEAPEIAVEILGATHSIRFWETGSARRRRKPPGAIGAEIYFCLDGDKNDFDRYVLGAVAARSPYLFKHSPADFGRQAHYYARWLTLRGEKSPPSLFATATIARVG